MKIDEYQKRSNFRCRHYHTGLSHPQCFDKDNAISEKIGYLDIECSGLQADFGIVLSFSLRDGAGRNYSSHITPEEIKNGTYDKRLLSELCHYMRMFDRVVTWYGDRFDIPFLRTRCLLHGIDFPVHLEVLHTDLWMFSRKKLKMHSNRLGVVAPFFGIESKGHPLNPTVWLQCLSGSEKALRWVQTHNNEDTESLRKVWHRVQRYVKLTKQSV